MMGNRRREDKETAKMQWVAKQEEHQETQKKESETTQTQQKEPPTTQRNTATVTNTTIQQTTEGQSRGHNKQRAHSIGGIPRENGGNRNSAIAGHTTATV